jgi:hypothetical protein
MAVYLNKFFYVLDTDPGEVYPEVRGCCLDVRQLPGKRLVGFFIC